MPRFKVVKQVPAIYREVHVVDAGSEDEAERALRGGTTRCIMRDFTTTPGAAQPAHFFPRVLSEQQPVGGEIPYPEGQKLGAEFQDSRFLTPPGADLQQVVQEREP